MIDVRLPLYQRLRDEIVENIASGVWRPGELLPPEAELARIHSIAIGTVRKAVDALVADGLVERQQGRGTFVRRPRLDVPMFRFFRYGDPKQVPGSRLLEREVVAAPPQEVAAALALGPDDAALRIARLRLADETPFLREEIWLPHARFAAMATVPEDEIGDLLYPAYDRLCGEVVARAEEVLTIGSADEQSARLLSLSIGAPLVVIERRAFGFGGGTVEWRRSYGAARYFRYKVDISRDTEADYTRSPRRSNKNI